MILCCATIAPEAARALDAKIVAAGFLMLDAPVSGGKAGAHGGTHDGDGLGFRCRVRQGAAGAGCDLGESVAAGRTGRRRQHRENGEPVARRRAHRNRGGGAGARHPRRRRSAHAVRGDLIIGGQFMDVAEPRAAYPGWRRHAAFRGEHLRQGSRHCAGPGARTDVPAADGLGGASAVPRRRRAWRWRRRTMHS